MQIVINIPKEVMESRQYCRYFGAWSEKLTETIENGVPLPERHGRLIDVDALIVEECTNCDGWCDYCACDCLNCQHQDEWCDLRQALEGADVLVDKGADDATRD